MARGIAVLGSASDVGKSVVAAGLCRLLSDAGLVVAPFKAQNMANQAGVTPEGREMPRAQILQARAAGVPPEVDMGPVLLKPVTSSSAQIVVLGEAIGQREAGDYFRDTTELREIALGALDRLAARFDVIVIEGAGSPVELNLLSRDFANLVPARRLGAFIMLVVDIDKGGVFAQAKGTLDLLPEEDRARVVGIVVNRFRGDRSLFEDGVRLLEQTCGVPVLSVVPYVDHGLDEEDRPLRIPVDEPVRAGKLHVGAVLSPRVANTEDLFPLLAEPDVQLTWLTRNDLIRQQDLVILPGSKATIGDLAFHASTGMAESVVAAHARGAWVLGLCGGYQMLGTDLRDDAGTEGGPRAWPGLGLLPVTTVFGPQKITGTHAFRSEWPEAGHVLTGYEIHHGRTAGGGRAVFAEGGADVGVWGERVVGAYLHGLFASDGWRAAFLNQVRRDRARLELPVTRGDTLELRIRRWASHLRASFRPGAWERVLAAVS